MSLIVWWKCSIAVRHVESVRGCGVIGGRADFPRCADRS